ncbi:MAG: SDR family NAD(P)-dependent oxidoreductase [Clostridiales bacterium]|nr:SDR family NAD(P)-dependent oxidoreductase [Clostridiales bacterium]
MSKVVLLTGGSKGIGYAAAKAFVEKGCRIYEISRHEVPNPGVFHITGDVTDPVSVESAVQSVIAREGQLDVLVCNAGTILSGAIEFIETDEVRKLLELNIFGVINCVRAVLPHMRNAGTGRIVCLSSMAAPFPIPFQAYYSVSKVGISAFASALHNEVKSFGISVCCVMPGDTNSDQVRLKAHQGDDVYGGKISRSVTIMEKDEKNGMTPEYVGQIISKIALKKRVKPFYAIGFMSKTEMFLKRIVTESFAQKIIGMMYVK